MKKQSIDGNLEQVEMSKTANWSAVNVNFQVTEERLKVQIVSTQP